MDVVAMTADHPIVVWQIPKLKLHCARECGMHMNLHLGEADVAVRFKYGNRRREFIETDWTIDLVHFEFSMLKRAKFNACTLGDGNDAAGFHRLERICAHCATLSDLNPGWVLLLDEFDQRFKHP